MRSILGILLATVAVSGCLAPSAEKTAPTDAQVLVDSMVYVKAKNGLCFGVGTTSHMVSNATFVENNVIVSVDCSKVSLAKTK